MKKLVDYILVVNSGWIFRMSKIHLKQELQQTLTPKQILQASLLQLNLTSLEQRILQELEINPALEMVELIDDVQEEEKTSIEDMEEDLGEEDEVEFEWEELLGVNEDYEYPILKRSSEEESDMPMVSQESFSDYYLKQLQDLNSNNQELKIAEEILGNLDSQGYLTIEPLLISDRLELKEETILKIMHKIQRLDPPGVASRNIQECLLAQAEQRDENLLAIEILKDYFDDFANHRYEKIIENKGCSKEDLNEAMEFISRLNPSPRDDQMAMSIDTIIPDISVEEKQGSFQIILNETVLPEIRVSRTYVNMLNTHKEQRDVVRFIKKKIESANWFVDAVKERKHTIEKVMESIIKHQSDYFKKEDRVLHPMILDDIAKDIEMDISTVSRVTNGKYVQLPWEIKELKKFFSESIQMESGEEVSNIEVKKRLSEMIESEDKTNPLGDIELTDKLNVEGYKIARRTVSKYREKLNFPTARLRRKI